MKLDKNEVIYSCLEFENCYVFNIFDKEDLKTDVLPPGTGKIVVISKDLRKEKTFYAGEEEAMFKLKKGKFIKELDEDDIDEVLKKIK